jgi:MFS family permease
VSIAAFDGLAITAALGAITEDLGHVALLPWVISAYLAASAVAVIVAGPVIDAIGVRRTFRITGAWFLAWSAAAAVAPTMPLLIVARAMQGIGGGLVMAVALAAVGLTYPPELRPRAFAANSMVWGVMGFGGPALAGLLLAVGEWRMIFVVQLPITGLALVIGWNALPGPATDGVRTPFDQVGVALLTVLTLGSLVALSEIGDRWDVFAGGLAVSVVAVAVYWGHARRASAPVVARRHITRFPAVGIHAVMAITLISGLALDNYLPIYVQVNRGHHESAAAFTLAFLAVGWTTGSIVYSRVFADLLPAAVMRGGMTVVALGCAAAAATIGFDAPLATVFAAYTVVGLGIGTVSTPSLTWLQASSEPAEMGRATSAHQFLRQLAITYGVAAGGAVLLLVVARQVDDVDAVREALAGEDVELGAGAAAAIGDGLATVAVVSAGLAVVGVAIATAVVRRARQTGTSGV